MYSTGKDAIIKDFKLKILIYFNSLITQTLNPLTANTLYLPHSFIKLSNFVTMEAIGQGLQCSLNFINKGTIWEDSSSFEFLSVRSPAYLPSLWTQWNMPTLFLRCAHCVHILSEVFGIDHLMFLLYLLFSFILVQLQGFGEWLQMWLAIQSRQQCHQGPFRRPSSFDFTFILQTKGVSSCTKFR